MYTASTVRQRLGSDAEVTGDTLRTDLRNGNLAALVLLRRCSRRRVPERPAGGPGAHAATDPPACQHPGNTSCKSTWD
ncbi:hypothetical protein AAFF_G00019280 [Aldrovandia affinis]|uniref:Uncharacterized protein n=1 Tax=Aldrovandia affinis TaxID=143900 RepID=A0AAD7S7Q2_9TELE|nr:hypothetical protein AAFF_G00019280 [Aldrovandia affinis]